MANVTGFYRYIGGVTVILSFSILVAIFLISVAPEKVVSKHGHFFISRIQRSTENNMNDKNKNGTLCYSNSSNTRNESWFKCPETGQNQDMTSCCGAPGKQICCKPEPAGNDKSQPTTEVDVVTAVSIITAFVVSISCCMMLYCCCCQKRPEIKSGKVVWVTKAKKRKLKSRDGTGDANAETELMDYEDYINKHHMLHAHDSEENTRKSKSHENLYHQETKLHSSHKNLSASNQDMTSTKQQMTVPLINIQASTPVDETSQ